LTEPKTETPTQPVAGEITNDEPTNEDHGQQQTTMGEFTDLLSKTKTPRDVEILRDHFTGPDSTIELHGDERDQINKACNSRREEISPTPPKTEKTKKQEQKPLMQ
jgi:hypothetical protein